MSNYTCEEIRQAIREHAESLVFKGYTCEAHGNELKFAKCICELFPRREERLGLKKAAAEVRYRLENGIPLRGWNSQDQAYFTY